MRIGTAMNAREKEMLRLFRSLGAEQQRTVSAFMEFLAGRKADVGEAEIRRPEPIERPPQESVVKAIKRLRATYPMLDQNRLFHDTSEKMMGHLMHGKPAAEVIDELEELFARHYRQYCAAQAGGEGDQSASEA